MKDGFNDVLKNHVTGRLGMRVAANMVRHRPRRRSDQDPSGCIRNWAAVQCAGRPRGSAGLALP